MSDFDTFGLQISETDALIIEASDWNFRMKRKRFTAWLIRDGKNIGMLQYLVGGESYDVPAVCDIEIREEFRGNKLGAYLIRMVEEFIIGGTLYTSGNFTPEGFRSLGNIIPVYPDSYEEAGVRFRSMNFVEDWEMFYLK